MRFAISLLVMLAVASIIGTVITQEEPYPNYVNQFGPFWADIFLGAGLYNVYGSWWFVLILIFVVTSVSICLTRNTPRMIAEMRSWKDRVREGSLRAFRHKGEFDVAAVCCSDAVTLVTDHAHKMGYKLITRRTETGGILIAGKRGVHNKLGYISAHAAIVVICIGALLDSKLPIELQMRLFGKTPTEIDTAIDAISPSHRLPPSNPTFRGFALVAEGQRASSAVLSVENGSLVQDLPFSIRLNKFVVDYYSTGMPKLFASDIAVIDHRTGERVVARVEVNKPFTYDGISIYQSSFQDGGSTLAMTAWPMRGSSSTAEPFEGMVGATTKIGPRAVSGKGEAVELTDFRAINVEDISDSNTRGGKKTHLLEEELDARLGSGAKSTKSTDLRNLGPSVRYKIRSADGQAREFVNYFLPIDVSGQRVFLAGVRVGVNDPFRFLRIPADEQNSVKEWMNLRAALGTPDLRVQATHRFVRRLQLDPEGPTPKHLEEQVLHVLDLFAGANPDETAIVSAPSLGGFRAISGLVDRSMPTLEQEKAARELLRTLEGVTWDLWQLARGRNGEPEAELDEKHRLFIRSSINALSDSFFYGAPVFLQLDSFNQVQASVFQLTRAPGKDVVYLGSLLLVLGIFSMFYVRERRLWFWLTDTENGGTRVLMAMSTARRTLDFEKDFARTRDSVGAMLGVANMHTTRVTSASVTPTASGGKQDPVK
nr:cytochrome c biogenesis protein ResB [Paraburkholderia sp. BL8N3]